MFSKGQESSPDDERRRPPTLVVTLLGLVVGFVALLWFSYHRSAPGKEVSLDQVYRLVAARQVVSARLLEEDAQIVGRRCADSGEPLSAPAASTPEAAPAGPVAPAAPLSCPGKVEAFHASYPASDVSTQQLIERITTEGGQVVVDKQTGVAVAKLVGTFLLPLLILANLFGLIFQARSDDSSLARIAGFGKVDRGKKRDGGQGPKVSFADVAGAGEAVTELREVTDYLRDPSRFEAFGAAVPKGVLLFGPPGCGKTLLARATAGETGVAFFSVAGTEFVESLVGVGAARVRDLFRQVREVAPAIVFIDEIDALGRRRAGEGMSGGEREQTLNQLLVELDGFDVTSGIVLIGATNRPDILDPALMRPGRFDRHITLEPPDVHGRRAILELHAKGRPMAGDVDFHALARQTPGFTGADLANVINEAALLAIRGGEGSAIRASHLSEAVLRVLHGPRRRGRLITPEERRRLAFHESGHAVVAAAGGQGGELHRVSIVARRGGLGQTLALPEGERVLLTASEMVAQLTVAMAGVAAEVLYCGESSTTSEDDLQRANAVAREMVGRYGMSERVGPLHLLAGHDGHGGADGMALEPLSAQTMHEFDHEVRRLVEEAQQEAAAVLRANEAVVERMVAALEKDESLEGPALEAALAGVNAVPPAAADGGAATAATGRSRDCAR